jgi:hypothetical protein
MYLITLFAIIAKLVFVSGDCDVGALNSSSFDVTKVSIDILRCFVYRNLPVTGYQYAFTLYYIGKILIIIPTNAQLVFIINFFKFYFIIFIIIINYNLLILLIIINYNL